ncbi:MAG TPA: PHP domain-containing protein [Methanocella sp.]|uniref:PHP domain-containing protein n=1 Tax=Methanocella sp. TaxID=2052833 RepID=UPI002C339845|nr:PHP domain-containing protein [Methanocella sp.]HTY90415.1 PHP domain-containing protein [Methanocella sp.]
MLIDTHVHTSYSDGRDTPEKVIADAAMAGIGLLSITDHDCVDAYPEAIGLARSAGIRLIPGVELTTKNERGCNCIHIVGLGIRMDAGVRQALKRVVDARDESDKGFLKNLNEYLEKKYPGWEPAEGIKPSVFQNTLANARRQGIAITEKEMMDLILDPSLWAPIEYEITVDEAVDRIKEWGGVPVLAHPFDFSNDASVVLQRFLAAGGEVVELCKYRYKVRSDVLSRLGPGELLKKEREMNEWTVAAARKHGLKLTMASDRHDGHRAMGMDPAEYGIDVSWLEELCAR